MKRLVGMAAALVLAGGVLTAPCGALAAPKGKGAKSPPAPPPAAEPAVPPPAAEPAAAAAPAPAPSPAPAPAAAPAPAPLPSAAAAPSPAPSSPWSPDTVALLPLSAPDPGTASAATSQAAQGLRDLNVFRVVDPDTIAGLLGAEALRQSSGCTEASCLAELAGAVGAAYVVSGSIAKSGDTYTLTMVLTDQRTAAALDGVVRQEKSLGDLGQGARLAAQTVVRKLLTDKQGTVRLVSPETGADVKIDDVLIGTTPLTPRQLPMGPHRISVEKTGFIAFRQEVMVRPNELVAVNAELIPSQEFINSYRTRNRVLRTLAWLGTGMAVASLGAGLAAYAGWMGMFMAFHKDGPSGAVDDLTRLPDLNRPQDAVAFQGSTLNSQWAWAPLDVMLGAMFLAPVLAAGWAVFGTVFWFVGEDPGRYNRYSE